MKSNNQINVLTIGLVLAIISPIFGAYILDEDKTNKLDAMITTFIPMSIGASMMFYVLFVKSDEEKGITSEIKSCEDLK